MLLLAEEIPVVVQVTNTLANVATALIGAAGAGFIAYLAYKTAQLKTAVNNVVTEAKTHADGANQKVEVVERKVDTVVNMTDRLYRLFEAEYGAALSSVAALARWKADQTGSAVDLASADWAEKALIDHQAKQKQITRKVAEVIKDEGVDL